MAHESILVVDDQPANIKLIQATLAGEGYRLSVATNATEALEAVRSSKPDLILMDIHLPGFGGLELTKLLKSDAQWRHIKIIAISAYASGEDEQRILGAGCDGYVAKPIDTRTLAGTLRKFLDK